jgi:arginine exporter protein ArgO
MKKRKKPEEYSYAHEIIQYFLVIILIIIAISGCGLLMVVIENPVISTAVMIAVPSVLVLYGLYRWLRMMHSAHSPDHPEQTDETQENGEQK